METRSHVRPTRISIAYRRIDSFAWKVSLLFRKNNSGPSAQEAVLDPRLTKYFARPEKEKYYLPHTRTTAVISRATSDR